jgi:hypothetical protein
MAQSHLLRIQMKRLKKLLERETALDHRAISVENIKTSCYFHHNRYRLPYVRSHLSHLRIGTASFAHAESLAAKPGPLGMGVTISVT